MNAATSTDEIKLAPFWWERTPRPQHAEHEKTPPQNAEVVVIGSGYTGLSAAIQTATQRETLVLDAEDAGWGCSTRNGGQVSTSIKLSYPQLEKSFGAKLALEILREGNRALEWIGDFIREQKIDCDFQITGRFHGAHTQKFYRELQNKLKQIPRELNIGAFDVARAEQHVEINTDFYHGGLVYPKHASIDPARYHNGLLNCAKNNGAKIFSHCRVENISRTRNGFQVETTRGKINAAEVIIATSGYTGAAAKHVAPWHRRRIIPIASSVIATEELPPEFALSLLPRARVITDSRRLVVYYRLCPRRRRILFGGRVSGGGGDLRASAKLLRAQMLQIFPQLSGARITHSWTGLVGYTFDSLPHTGVQAGAHYAMGYCGSGISLASYCGMKTGLRVLGDARAPTALATPPFPARAYYRGRAWFLPAAVAYYRMRDAFDARLT